MRSLPFSPRSTFLRWKEVGGQRWRLGVSEALKANTCNALSFTDSGNGFSNEDRTCVSSDLKVLLDDSKYKGNLQCGKLITLIHGHLRSVYKSVHYSTQIALNSNSLTNGSVCKSKDLTALFSSLSYTLKNLGDSSWHRATICLKTQLISYFG